MKHLNMLARSSRMLCQLCWNSRVIPSHFLSSSVRPKLRHQCLQLSGGSHTNLSSQLYSTTRNNDVFSRHLE